MSEGGWLLGDKRNYRDEGRPLWAAHVHKHHNVADLCVAAEAGESCAPRALVDPHAVTTLGAADQRCVERAARPVSDVSKPNMPDQCPIVRREEVMMVLVVHSNDSEDGLLPSFSLR